MCGVFERDLEGKTSEMNTFHSPTPKCFMVDFNYFWGTDLESGTVFVPKKNAFQPSCQYVGSQNYFNAQNMSLDIYSETSSQITMEILHILQFMANQEKGMDCLFELPPPF